MNKMWGFIYNMEDIGILNEILSGEDCQIIHLSYTSQFGFVFKMVYPGKTEILKTYILVDSDKSSKGRDFELPNYVDLNLAKDLEDKEIDPYDELPGHVKRMETISNFTREAQIQNDVYNASINNGPLCPEIYGSYILYHEIATAFLESLKTKCQEQLEGENMIQYLQNNLHRYDLGIIRMEYAEGYITFREAPENQLLEEKIQLTKLKNKLPTEEIQKLTEKIQLLIEINRPFYENVIYANIRLLMEAGYMHLDLNPGNVMVRGDDVLLIDFGKSKSITDIKKNDFTNISKIIEKIPLEPDDIKSMISFINSIDDIENDSSLFQENFVSRLSNPGESYQNITNKLNKRENKTVSPKYGQLQQILQNTAVSSNSPQTNHVFGFIGSESPSSPESNKRSSLFGFESPPSSLESNKRENKTVSPKYGQLQQILQNTAVSINSPQTNHVFGFIGSESPSSPESNKRSSLFGFESPPSSLESNKRSPLFVSESSVKRIGLSRNSDVENIPKNIFLGTPPTKPRGGAKKSKKTKRKPLHNKRKSKTHKNKSNKKRVKLISKK